ncbi:aromatic-ring-hydroxylating dioxygenase subunit beta [Mycolicibacterium wolinskyi]|uniref:aromatic-ring-hydroxylating dioxygenase subunit beta n=1 Tax=Mycolicibacterium wolinskyi TaxID=59750 RepID=UPI003917A5A8
MTTTELNVSAARIDVPRIDKDTVEAFIYHEVDLLDQRKFIEWLALFTNDAHYWIPSGFDDLDPSRSVSIVYDDHQLLTERAQRLTGTLAYAQIPPSRTAHVVGNVQLLEVATADDGTATARVQAKFAVAEFRRNTRFLHAGRVSYTLVDFGAGLRIRLKKVELIDNDGYLGNLSMPL